MNAKAFFRRDREDSKVVRRVDESSEYFIKTFIDNRVDFSAVILSKIFFTSKIHLTEKRTLMAPSLIGTIQT